HREVAGTVGANHRSRRFGTCRAELINIPRPWWVRGPSFARVGLDHAKPVDFSELLAIAQELTEST
ncbi:MAG: hypothetical protein ACREXU_23265, partial [Gammaproteobacteria bacterium]